MKEEDYSFYQEIEADYHKQDDYIAIKKEKEIIIKRRKQQKQIEFIENNTQSFYLYSRDDDLKDIYKLLSSGNEVKTNDIELVKIITKVKKIKKKIGTQKIKDYVIETLSYMDKKIFCIRKE